MPLECNPNRVRASVSELLPIALLFTARSCHRNAFGSFIQKSCLILFLLFLSPYALATQNWTASVDNSVALFDVSLESRETLFVGTPGDASRKEAYYPFSNEIKTAITGSLLKNGYRVVEDPLDAKAFVNSQYTVSRSGLTLTLKVSAAETGNLLATQTINIKDRDLPAGWNKRTLQDIGYELSIKLEKTLFGQKIQFTTGSITDKQGLISEFSSAINWYLITELSRRNMFQRVDPETASGKVFKLQGDFEILDRSVLLTASFIDPSTDALKASVQASFPASAIPNSMPTAPANKAHAEEALELNTSVLPEELRDTVALWVNHDNGMYRDGDNLIVNVKTSKNLYMRLYYIQSDGLICQIFPAGKNGSGYLGKGQVYQVGGASDAIELIISDETTGQEIIKAFASLGPIKDESLPKEFSEAENMSCMTEGYRKLQEDLTRALKLKHKVRPVTETKILVTDKAVDISQS
jgi:hypothetical protein